jgi:hypothetical protein
VFVGSLEEDVAGCLASVDAVARVPTASVGEAGLVMVVLLGGVRAATAVWRWCEWISSGSRMYAYKLASHRPFGPELSWVSGRPSRVRMVSQPALFVTCGRWSAPGRCMRASKYRPAGSRRR